MSNGLTPRDVEAILQYSQEQLEIRKRELDIQKQQTEGNIDYAKQALEAQASDLELTRQHEREQTKTRNRLVLILSALIIAFLIYALQTDNEQFAQDFFKILMGFLAGGGAAYWWGKASRSPQSPQQSQTS